MELRVFTEPQQGASYDDLLRVAQKTEELGFGAFFRSDHFLGMGTDGLPGPTDAWVTLGALARETSTIRLGTLVTSVTFRWPGSPSVPMPRKWWDPQTSPNPSSSVFWQPAQVAAYEALLGLGVNTRSSPCGPPRGYHFFFRRGGGFSFFFFFVCVSFVTYCCHVRAMPPVGADEGVVVHLVDVVAGQDEDDVGRRLQDRVEVAEDGVGGAAVPLERRARGRCRAASGGCRRCCGRGPTPAQGRYGRSASAGCTASGPSRR